MTHRLHNFVSLAALAAISLAAAACESTGNDWGASNDVDNGTLNQANIVPANGDAGDRDTQRVANPLYPPMPSSPPVANDPGNFKPDPGTASERP